MSGNATPSKESSYKQLTPEEKEKVDEQVYDALKQHYRGFNSAPDSELKRAQELFAKKAIAARPAAVTPVNGQNGTWEIRISGGDVEFADSVFVPCSGR